MWKYILLLLLAINCNASTLCISASIDNPANSIIQPFNWYASTYNSSDLDMFISEGEDDTPCISLKCEPVNLIPHIIIRSIELSISTQEDLSISGLSKTFEVNLSENININSDYVNDINSVFSWSYGNLER